MKEYEMVSIMSEAYSNVFSKALTMIANAIGDKHYDMLDMTVARAKVEEVFKAIEVKKRFDYLCGKSNQKLKCTTTGFEFDTHKLETLDEAERLLKNKAFL